MNDRKFLLTIIGNPEGSYPFCDSDQIQTVLELILPLAKDRIVVEEIQDSNQKETEL